MHHPSQPLQELPFSERDTIDLVVDSPSPSNRWAWLIDRNPLFLISGVCMLGGCFLVSGAIHAHDPAEAGQGKVLLMLIALLAVLNVYEVAVIWLGLALSRSKTLVRDTRHLIGLTLLLLIDTAFVYNETSIFKPEVGGLIAGIAALLAIGKAGWIAYSLGIRPTRCAAAVVSVSLAMMYAMPVLVRLMAHDGFLSQPLAMLVWCATGAVVAAYALPQNWLTFQDSDNPDHRQFQRLVAGGLIVLPLLSLVAHAAALLWVYENAFELSMLSPALLGLAALVLRQQDRLGGPTACTKAATIIVAAAIVPCLLPTDKLIYESLTYSWLAFSPLRGILLLSPFVLAWGWWINHRSMPGAVTATLPWLFAALGHSPRTMLQNGRWLIDSISDWLPRTQLQWGALAILTAFALLIIGGFVSWRRQTSVTESQ